MRNNIFSDEKFWPAGHSSRASFDICKPETKAMIIHPGALGDCVLTLRLADFIKRNLGIDRIDFAGRRSNIEFFPGRTPVDRIMDIDCLALTRLFCDPDKFELDEHDPLPANLSGYQWVLSFLGEKGGNFEQNLIYTLYQTTSSEFVTLSPKPAEGYRDHISRFHIEEFYHEKGPSIEALSVTDELTIDTENPLITPVPEDIRTGGELLKSAGCPNPDRAVIIAPGSGDRKKNWAFDNFTDLAGRLSERGYHPVFLAGPVEKERMSREIEQMSNYGRILTDISTAQLVAVFSVCAGCIGNDSGPLHLSGMMGTATLAIFGETNHIHYRPIGSRASVVSQPRDAFQSHRPEQVQTLLQEFLSLLG